MITANREMFYFHIKWICKKKLTAFVCLTGGLTAVSLRFGNCKLTACVLKNMEKFVGFAYFL